MPLAATATRPGLRKGMKKQVGKADKPGRVRTGTRAVLCMAAIVVAGALYLATRPGGPLSSRMEYVDRINGFSLLHPVGWKVLPSYGDTDIVLVPTRDGKAAFQDNVNVRHARTPAGQGMVADQVLGELKEAGADVSLLEQRNEEIDGNRAVKLVYHTTVNGSHFAMISYVIPLESTWFITCTTLPEGLAAFQGDCEALAKSFRRIAP